MTSQKNNKAVAILEKSLASVIMTRKKSNLSLHRRKGKHKVKIGRSAFKSPSSQSKSDLNAGSSYATPSNISSVKRRQSNINGRDYSRSKSSSCRKVSVSTNLKGTQRVPCSKYTANTASPGSLRSSITKEKSRFKPSVVRKAAPTKSPKTVYSPTRSPFHKRFRSVVSPAKSPFRKSFKPMKLEFGSHNFSNSFEHETVEKTTFDASECCSSKELFSEHNYFDRKDSDGTRESYLEPIVEYTDKQTEYAACSEKDSQCNEGINEMIDLVPKVLKMLESVGIENIFHDFFRQVHEGSFPLDNIAFLLWVEVVRWHGQDNTSSMRYMNETKKFTKLGWRLFGGRFIRFMSGFKNDTQVVFGHTERGVYEPRKSEVNFVVPSVAILREFAPYGNEISRSRQPGIFTDVMQLVSNALESSYACLTFDGKKLKQGLTHNSGDVDILGFETGPTLLERQTRLKEKLNRMESLEEKLTLYQELSEDIKQLPPELRLEIKDTLIWAIKVLSENVHKSRSVKEKKEYAKQKFIERGGSDWRNGKFIYIISAIHAFLYELETFLTKSSEVRQNMCLVAASLQDVEHLYVDQEKVNLQIQANYIPIPESVDTSTDIDTRLIKQRTGKWFEIRKRARVTGSTLYKALGLDGLNKMKEHFDLVVCGILEKEPSEEAKKAMQYGTENEINATATLVAKILPVIAPDLYFFEEGCIAIEHNNQTFMVVSPDGSLRKLDADGGHIVTEAAVEIKCPTTSVHTELPVRYYLQCLAEMEALEVQRLLYVCWRPDVTTVFEVMHDKDLYQRAFNLAVSIYAKDNPKRPNKLSTESKQLKEDIKGKCKTVVLLGEFLSVTAAEIDVGQYEYPPLSNTCADLNKLLKDIRSLYLTAYELHRQKASEALVFLCWDLDRHWSKNPLRWSPVCWCPKGYSLTNETVRKLLEHVHDECHKHGVHVPAVSFDGQWHNIVVRSLDCKPLTMLQLQKDVWKEVERMQKSDIVKDISDMNKKVVCLKTQNGGIVCSNGGISLPKTSPRGWIKRTQTGAKSTNIKCGNLPEEGPSLLNAIPETVLDNMITGLEKDINYYLGNKDLLACTYDQGISEEFLSCNITEEHWSAMLRNSRETHATHENEDLAAIEILGTSLGDNIDSLILRKENSHEAEQRSILGQNMQLETNNISTLSMCDAKAILALLQTDASSNKKQNWTCKEADDVIIMCSGYESLSKARDVDIRVVVRYLRKTRGLKIKEYEPKGEKIRKLCHFFGFNINVTGNQTVRKPIRVNKQVRKLSDLSKSAIMSKVPKQSLNITYAEYLWPTKLKEWRDTSPVSDNVKIKDTDFPEFWFYTPEFSKSRSQLEVRCIDSTHLLTRTRRKTCKGGIEQMDKAPWIKVALQKKTFLSPIMVEDVIDPMSMSMALTHFSEAVQDAMRSNGDFRAASLCEDVLNWWKAEDNPGISAAERIRMRSKLRKRLLGSIDFGQFPPPTMYVNGWPIQLWEALVASIDAKALLYPLCRKGTYNVRAFSSMMGETFFAELANQDSRGQGTVSASEFAEFIGHAIEQMQMRLDKSRSFVYRTSRSTVYEAVGNEDDNIRGDGEVQLLTNTSLENRVISEIVPKDHFFDSPDRKRVAGKKREGTVSTERNSLLKGTLGVRWEKARRNESKILMDKKIGHPDAF